MYQPTRRPLLAGMRRTAATIALAVIAAIGLVGPASACISGTDAGALPQGATRYAVQQATGAGCHVADSQSDGTADLRKLYKVQGGSMWLVVSYAKTAGQAHYHLTSKSIGNDLQLLGAQCS